MKAERVTVFYDKAKGKWISASALREIPHTRKIDAVEAAISYCRREAKFGRICELVIKNKNGRIGKGNGAKRTYPRGADPRRSRG